MNIPFHLKMSVSMGNSGNNTLSSHQGQVQISTELQPAITLEFSGGWSQQCHIRPAELLLDELSSLPSITKLTLSVQNVSDWDSRLPAYLLKICRFCSAQNIPVHYDFNDSGLTQLLNLALTVPEQTNDQTSQKQSLLHHLGVGVLRVHYNFRALTEFIGAIVLSVFDLLRGQARFRLLDLWRHIQEAGPEALPIVGLISLLVGLILAFVGAVQLAMFGAEIYIADLVGLGTVREMGALMTAVIMTGRTGASYAAQLGTMMVNSEIDALQTMGISPMTFLVLPRMLALFLMMPLLCLYADLVGIVGGGLITVSFFEVSWPQYIHEISRSVHFHDFGVGLFKSTVFAILIALAGCMRGMQCGRSASAVGEATTAAVVDSIIFIVIADSVMTLICDRLGV
jgi:phospholipid/cholesterol/gamma-HCH transport system permease protein